VTPLGAALSRIVARAGSLRWIAVLVLIAGCAVILTRTASLWNHSLGSLSPVSQAEAELDANLRADSGAPDARYLVVVSGASQEAVLQAAESVAAVLQRLVDGGDLTGFSSPTRFLPSEAAQRRRQASLPPSGELQSRLAEAVAGLPIDAKRLAPFVADVDAAREQPLLQAKALEGTSLAMAVDALLLERRDGWSVLMPLTAGAGTDIDANKVRAALARANVARALFVDMKSESYRLYSGYLNEAITLSLAGLAAIVALLIAALRSVTRMLRVIAPLAAAVITVTAGLTLLGQQLTLLHLVGLLLVVAIGSNYALFFDRGTYDGTTNMMTPRTLASMLLANCTTVAGFGLLAFSKVSILQAMGATVAPGVVLALIFAAIFAKPARD
jgi:predicted exporter